MDSIESIRPTNRKPSFKIIEKRLSHLREELYILTNKEHDQHHMQYKKRLEQLLRLYDKQV